MWLIDKQNNWAMSNLPRVGSHSIRSFMAQANIEVLPSPEPSRKVVKLGIERRIVWLRNPFDRLLSNYSMFKVLNERDQYQGRPCPAETETWESFIDFVLDGNDNTHWDSQIEQLSFDGVYLGTETYRFEDIHNHWSKYYRGKVPHINGYTHEQIDKTYRIADVNSKYFRDIETWQSL